MGRPITFLKQASPRGVGILVNVRNDGMFCNDSKSLGLSGLSICQDHRNIESV